MRFTKMKSKNITNTIMKKMLNTMSMWILVEIERISIEIEKSFIEIARICIETEKDVHRNSKDFH